MRFTIPPDHPCLPGHFPGHPVVPGVVVLEQVMTAIASADAVPAPWRLPQVKFLAPLLPGQEAEVRIEGAAPRWWFEVRHADAVLARGEIRSAAA